MGEEGGISPRANTAGTKLEKIQFENKTKMREERRKKTLLEFKWFLAVELPQNDPRRTREERRGNVVNPNSLYTMLAFIQTCTAYYDRLHFTLLYIFLPDCYKSGWSPLKSTRTGRNGVLWFLFHGKWWVSGHCPFGFKRTYRADSLSLRQFIGRNWIK